MKPCYQTVDIMYPFSSKVFQTMGFCPRLPNDLVKHWDITGQAIRIIDDENSMFTWYPEGTVVKIMADGTTKTWYYRPDLKNALTMTPGGVFTEFGNDYIIARYGDKTYYWTKIETIAVTEGKIQKGLKLSNGNWSFYDLEDEEYIHQICNWHLSQSD